MQRRHLLYSFPCERGRNALLRNPRLVKRRHKQNLASNQRKRRRLRAIRRSRPRLPLRILLQTHRFNLLQILRENMSSKRSLSGLLPQLRVSHLDLHLEQRKFRNHRHYRCRAKPELRLRGPDEQNLHPLDCHFDQRLERSCQFTVNRK